MPHCFFFNEITQKKNLNNKVRQLLHAVKRHGKEVYFRFYGSREQVMSQFSGDGGIKIRSDKDFKKR